MAAIDREAEAALDTARDRYGRTVHHQVAAAARARRNHAAVDTYATYLAAHAGPLLDAARSAVDGLPPARHTRAWRDLLDALVTSHTEIVRILDRPAPPGSAAEREQHTLVWPHLAAWADYGTIAADLAEQTHQPEPGLTDEERQMWTEMAQAARRRGELDLFESWYVADGRRITLAYLVEDEDSTVVALAGDPGAPGWEVIGHYAHEWTAGQALPRPVPPGVLRPDAASRFNRPEPAPERPLQELVQEVVEARAAGDVADALLSATQTGYDAGPMVRLQHLLSTAAEFSYALETAQGRQIGARLDALGRQLDFLVQEVHDAAEDLVATVAVLPPHRTPKPPRIRPRPALETTPPPAPPQRTTTTARHP
ncbi:MULTISPECIES: hypothetical protein [Streptomyces]|uniref:Uncharacterized protein n=2 Tax=Streptomyces rimosus subsp. rimosus TaxID=132474 RepID=L8EZJ2_STRR1|nr:MULTISPECIES: hypothetical protein [Streptomyces]KOG67276.1 hypothetical protein ADK78_41530 [Kitasatospora aureofaciens]KOT25904.1 hypothetical protein ADK42_40190 [Streptomyces rimosus subsp. rimosus]KOT25916.1 hypothetical protein ADK84_41745 [Streptomyces sp. NRRL WC-3701]KOT66972.1 hypothetical protein ADK47_41390 [Streptomyces rimosus subsp. rimosus]KOT67514.1 hypothetical protein ADK44_03430 [Streptomyces rimosus subsp. rimosus]